MACVNDELQLAARQGSSIVLWNLRNNLDQFRINGEDLSFGSFVITERDELVFSHNGRTNFKVALRRKSSQVPKMTLPANTVLTRWLPNGEAVVVRERFSNDPLFLEESPSLSDLPDADSQYSVEYFGFGDAGEHHQDEFSLFRSGVESGESASSALFSVNEEICAFNVKSDLRAGGRSAANTLFDFEKNEDLDLKNHRFLYLTVGTLEGSIFECLFLEDGPGAFSKEFENRISPKLEAPRDSEKAPNKPNMESNFATREVNSEELPQIPKWSINDVVRLAGADVLVTAHCEKKEDSNWCVVSLKYRKHKWTCDGFDIGFADKVLPVHFFKIHFMDADAAQNALCFYLLSPLGIAVMRFQKTENRLSVVKFLKKHIRVAAGVEYSARTESFYIPKGRWVQVWDRALARKTFQIDLGHEVVKIRLDSGASVLLVYDEQRFSQVELKSAQFQRRLEMFGDEPAGGFPVNMQLFPRGEAFDMPQFHDEITSLSFFSNSDIFDLVRFPFTSLLNCFEEENAQHIWDFAGYYFGEIKHFGYKDYLYGCLNPLFLAVYHNDVGLLGRLLSEYRFPMKLRKGLSLLDYATKLNFHSVIKCICDQLLTRKYKIEFSYDDFMCLLRSRYSYCHKLASTIPKPPEIQNYPSLICIRRNSKLFFVRSIDQVAGEIERNQKKFKRAVRETPQSSESDANKSRDLVTWRTDEDAPSETVNARVSGAREADSFSLPEQSKSETCTVQIPFHFEYARGSVDSLCFLRNYSESRCEEFVLSDWKEVILFKWRTSFFFQLILATFYWVSTLLVTLSMVFYPRSHALWGLSVGFISAFVLFEVLQILAYSANELHLYFKDFWNVVDWLNFVMLLLYFLGFHQRPESSVNKIMSTLGLIVTFYRSFSYVRIFESFTTLVGMINIIIRELVVFFFIMVYFYAFAALLMIKLSGSRQFHLLFEKAYVITFFGGLSTADFGEYQYGTVALIFGTIVVTVILLNILIAYLSNLFSRLEEQQSLNSFREKASMIFDFEILVSMIKALPQKLKRAKPAAKEPPAGYGDTPRRTESEQKKGSILYIFKKTGTKSMTDANQNLEENIYRRVKKIKKSMKKLTRYVHLRDRQLDDSFKDIRELIMKMCTRDLVSSQKKLKSIQL